MNLRIFIASVILWGLQGLHAMAEPPTLSDLMALREIGGYRSGLAVAPDGEHAAFFEREADLTANTWRYRLIVVRLSDGARRTVADGGAAIPYHVRGRFNGAPADRVPAWSPDGAWLAYRHAGEDGVSLWRVRPDGSDASQIANPDGDVERFAWLDADHMIFETATPRSSLADAAAQAARTGFHADERFEPYYSLRPIPDLETGREVSVSAMRSGAISPASDAQRSALRDEPPPLAPAGAIAWHERDGLAFIAPLTPGDRAMRPSLGVFVANDGAIVRCTASACSGRLIGVWRFGGDVVFLRHEGHGGADSALYRWSPSRYRVTRLRSGDEALYGCSAAAAALICFQETPTQPRRLVSVAIDTGALTIIYDPNPQWRTYSTTAVERLFVEDRFANQCYAHLVWPHGYRRGRRHPMVVVQYRSRGFLRGGTGGEYPVHALAGRGYFVLSVERCEWQERARTTTASALQLETELDNSENEMKQSQLEALIELAVDRGLVDRRRIGVSGLSDGAETLYWALTRSDLFAAAVASTPPTDPLAWTLGSEWFRERSRAQGAEGPWDDARPPWSDWWARNSIVRHADNIHAPLLMNLGESEALMGFPLAVRLRELGRPVEVYVYPGAHHLKLRPAQLLAAQTRALDWFDFWLHSRAHADPAEPGRRERWERLGRSPPAP